MGITRYYFSNTAPGYTPVTIRGAWDLTTGTIAMKLGAKAGVAATRGQAETSSVTNYDVLLGRWISDALSATQFKTSMLVRWSFGTRESNSNANDYTHIHIYITTGDSDTPRGTILTDSVGGTEWVVTTAASRYRSVNLSGAVSAQANDRIVVELGYQARNTSTTSRTGTMNYGNTGGTDLNAADGDTAVTTRPGWIEFVDYFSTPPFKRTHYLWNRRK
jgi:hypothetical protein